MTQYTILLTLFWCLSSSCPEGMYQGPPTTDLIFVRSKIYEVKPTIQQYKADIISKLIVNNCDKNDWVDAVRIAWVESSFRFLNSFPDIGLMQLSSKWHPGVEEFDRNQRMAYACSLIKTAKQKGNLAYYHSTESPFKEQYEKRLSEVLNNE